MPGCTRCFVDIIFHFSTELKDTKENEVQRFDHIGPNPRKQLHWV